MIADTKVGVTSSALCIDITTRLLLRDGTVLMASSKGTDAMGVVDKFITEEE